MKIIIVKYRLLFSQFSKKAPSEMISMKCGPIVYLVNNVVSRMVWHISNITEKIFAPKMWARQMQWNFPCYVFYSKRTKVAFSRVGSISTDIGLGHRNIQN